MSLVGFRFIALAHSTQEPVGIRRGYLSGLRKSYQPAHQVHKHEDFPRISISSALERGTASPFCESLISHTFIIGIILLILPCRAGFFSTKVGIGQALFPLIYFRIACVRVASLFCFLSLFLRILFVFSTASPLP